MNSDEMIAGHKPAVRTPQRGELLFSFRDHQHRQIDCELRDHGSHGIEAQFYIDREFSRSIRFDTRAAAVLWAQIERQHLERIPSE